MNPALAAAIIFACLSCAVLLGMQTRRRLPEHSLGADTQDSVKLAVGLIATMSALLLGLLISSAKSSFDTARSEVIGMAAQVAFLDRLLSVYGPEAAPLHAVLRSAVEQAIPHIWSDDAVSASPSANALYVAIQTLTPHSHTQRSLREDAVRTAVELGRMRMLLHAQSVTSISRPLLVVVIIWLVAIFFAFALLAPRNATATIALLASALSVAGALFLILEMDRPFTGLIQISSDPLVNVLGQLGK